MWHTVTNTQLREHIKINNSETHQAIFFIDHCVSPYVYICKFLGIRLLCVYVIYFHLCSCIYDDVARLLTVFGNGACVATQVTASYTRTQLRDCCHNVSNKAGICNI